jgi:hypothetical protein
MQKQTPIELNGHPGRGVTFTAKHTTTAAEGSFQMREYRGEVRLYIVANRLYQVMAIIPKYDRDTKAIGEFLDSFGLLGERSVMVQSAAEPQSVASVPSAAVATPVGSQGPALVPLKPAARPPVKPARRSFAGGATLLDFRWVDADQDYLGGHGGHDKTDNCKHQHFQLELDLPPDTTLEQITITCGGFHK